MLWRLTSLALGLSLAGSTFAFGHGGGGHGGGGHAQGAHAFAQHPNQSGTVLHHENQWPATMKASSYHPMTHSIVKYSPNQITKTAVFHPAAKYTNITTKSAVFHPVVNHPNAVNNYHPAATTYNWHHGYTTYNNSLYHNNTVYNNYWYHGYPAYNNYWYHGHYPVNYPYYHNYWYYNNTYYNYNNGVNDFLAAALVISLTANVLQAVSDQSTTTTYPAPVYYYTYPGYYAPVPYAQPVIAP